MAGIWTLCQAQPRLAGYSSNNRTGGGGQELGTGGVTPRPEPQVSPCWSHGLGWGAADRLPELRTFFWWVKRFSSSWTLLCSSSKASFALFFS